MAGKRLSNGLNVDRLDRVIQDLGVRIKLYKSTLVPNMTSLESMDQDLNSSVGNNNFIDFDCKETLAMFQQQDLMEQFKIQGTFHIDEVLMSFKAGLTLAPFAKIELIDFQEDFYELIQRQEGADVDLLKYKACDVVAIFTATTNTIDRYHRGTDFELDQNGSIKWIGTHKPADRQIYSIYYKYHPTYRAIKAVHRDRFSQYNLRPQNIEAPHITIGANTYIKMPETWIVKRDYLLERRDLSGQLLDRNEFFDPNE